MWLLQGRGRTTGRKVGQLAKFERERTFCSAGNPMLVSDEQLLQRTAQGDCQAFAEFYDRHAARAFGLLVKLLPSRSDAEDVLQEVFWQVWRNAGRFDPRRAPPAVWVFAIARSRAIDELRRRHHAATMSSTAMPGIAKAEQTDSPFENLLDNERQSAVRQALEGLPLEQQTAIMMSFFRGQSHAQVAREQGIPLGTVKTRISLGMKRLRNLLHLEREERVP
jgi:RNA polymerase sigma-70 factor (ECF subfamily)